MYHVPAIIIFNKYDLYKAKEKAIFEEWKNSYERVGYKTVAMSVKRKYWCG